LSKIKAMEVPVMDQAIGAYHTITASSEFREMERLNSLAWHNEASALRHAAEVERKKWLGVVADKDAALVNKDVALADKDAALAEQSIAHKEHPTTLMEQAALIAELRAQLGKDK
jgi:hypothetical protein